MNRVQLAVSCVGGIPGANAFHTSVLVDGMEYSYGSTYGLEEAQGPVSHRLFGGTPNVRYLGSTAVSGKWLQQVLAPHFQAASYDLLRKNCNSFSDCAIFLLLRQRLDKEYCALERVGAIMPALVRVVSGGQYSPNPLADGFNPEALIEYLDSDKPFANLNFLTLDQEKAEAQRRYSAKNGQAAPTDLAMANDRVVTKSNGKLAVRLGDAFKTAFRFSENIDVLEERGLAQELHSKDEQIKTDAQIARALQEEEDLAARRTQSAAHLRPGARKGEFVTRRTPRRRSESRGGSRRALINRTLP